MNVPSYVFVGSSPVAVTYNIFRFKSQTWWYIFILQHAEVLNKTEHGLTEIIIVWNKFKPVLHPRLWGNNVTYTYCLLEWNWRPSTMVGACVKKFLKSLTMLSKKWTQLNLVLKNLGSVFGFPCWFIDTNIPIGKVWHCKFQQPGYYDLVQWLPQIIHTLGNL